MPTYEYECMKCGRTFELLQKMSDPPVKKCPKCSGKVKRLIGSGSGIIFKGSGFYETDYKRKAKPEPKAETKPSGCPNSGPGGCSGCSR
ncbi:MAG TPA: FmdB family zinc ribbon protein [Patescibacteria group bacterium]|nr:FmdB family zinc ribbon protein [Patescibacteria group bacterium]